MDELINASVVERELHESDSSRFNSKECLVDLVILENYNLLVKSFLRVLSKDKKVDVYSNPEELLKNLDKYGLNTVIMFGNYFDSSKLTGLELSHKLSKAGYSNLYLCSGSEFPADKISHLKFLPKSNTEQLIQFLKSI